MKKIHIFSGGTVSHVRNHLALCAPAYGNTGRQLADMCDEMIPEMQTCLWQSRMAGGIAFETPLDLAELVDDVVKDLDTKIVFFPVAVVDFEGLAGNRASGRHAARLETRAKNCPSYIDIMVREKIISRIRRDRKDIFLVGFKTVCDELPDETICQGMRLLKGSSCNLVFVNDVVKRTNMILTPEDGKYEFSDRHAALEELVNMAKMRSHLTFTRSTVVAGDPVPWSDDRVPAVMREVMDHCVRRGAYKPFAGYTPGHFAIKIAPNEFLTSRRKTNFNHSLDLVRVVTDGPDTVMAYGCKPSVGGQSQRIVFETVDADCIVHFHCPIKPGSQVPIVSQKEYECGSHECGQNTASGLKKFGNLWAVHLDNHGPNIVFDKGISAMEVIEFIEANFDLEKNT